MDLQTGAHHEMLAQRAVIELLEAENSIKSQQALLLACVHKSRFRSMLCMSFFAELPCLKVAKRFVAAMLRLN